jgi:hypothetical protein
MRRFNIGRHPRNKVDATGTLWRLDDCVPVSTTEEIMADIDIAARLATTKRSPTSSTAGAKKDTSSVVAKFMLNAVNTQVGRVSEILNGTADSIDEILGGKDSPLPDTAKGVATSTSAKLRELAGRANEEEAAKLIKGLQRTAANHPAATAGIGAALGAALGLALAKLSKTTPPKSK